MDFAINADILFRDAYSLSDPAPELLKLIKFHPTRNTIAWLMTCYFQAVEKNPPRACALTSTLVTLRESPYGPIMQDGSTLERELRRELDYRFMLRFDEIDLAKHKFGRIGPSNPYLITCLLSALSLKYNLSSPSYVIHYQQSLPGLVTQCKSSICRRPPVY
ncbi:hypothetical protein M413DRAFT_27604 [Hebeloma cylindrosporum]|uniref:Uncharacterized protein n=1 Tax=Hebeloma cylindrosporum TaxID=76867 RepID=A0A0C3BXB8_HEBCY|nr:hypothetical protein M413DRAFT_27604 [Hebeloma cylindrosporum h7]